MCGGPPPRKLAAMTTRSVQIDLRVEIDGVDVRGVADDGSGTPRHFHGWLALISALDALLSDQPSTPAAAVPADSTS